MIVALDIRSAFMTEIAPTLAPSVLPYLNFKIPLSVITAIFQPTGISFIYFNNRRGC